MGKLFYSRSLAGRAIATRVITSPPQPTDGLFYFITDHLSSTRLLAIPNGSPVPGTTAHYLPYGDYRGSAPTATPLTERGYTGHHENREIGLTYMNARFYSPTTGRFLTADTIVPAPENPQTYNRYAYTLGNPLLFTDSTGHCAEIGDETCWSYAEQLNREYGLSLKFLGTMTMAQMIFFIDGLNAARGIDNDLPELIIAEINRLDQELPDWLYSLNNQHRWDAIGIRIEGSFGLIFGLQGDIDFVFNFNSWEFSIFLTPGAQIGALAGGSGGIGIYFGFNAPSNSSYWGWGWGITAQIVPAGGGGGIQYNDSGSAWSLVVGINGGEEFDLTIGGGYTFEVLRHIGSPSGTTSQTIMAPQIWYWRGYLYNFFHR
ncbi:MAG: RHS repeat-associated core domain-containing protein [Anaerolineae bacterium]|nr:RHS repeat-associated core domain-containing protein [Anaerolineae bacterium]